MVKFSVVDLLKSIVFIVVIGAMMTSPSFAQEKKWSVTPRVGYSVQNFNWTIAGTEAGNSPNILSELIWQDLRAINYNLRAAYRLSEKFDVSASGSYDQIIGGFGNDSDYASSNRAANFYSLDFNSNTGNTYAFSLIGGYRLPQLGPLLFRALLGYSQLGQNLYLLGLPGDETAIGLRSTYQTDWYGANAGVELSYPFAKFRLSGFYKFGLYDYQAKANWNLIETFQQPVSFRQYALGAVHHGQIQLRYALREHVGILVAAEYSSGYTLPGLDLAYGSNGSISRTRLNAATYNRFAANAGLHYSF